MLTASTILMMAVFIGLEPAEGENAAAENLENLTNRLDEFDLTIDQFTTESNGFNIGYCRGLQGLTFDAEQVPVGTDGNPVSEFLLAIEEGYAFALEARDMKIPPPSNLVYSAWKSGALLGGNFEAWASTLNLADTFRLGVAITVGSGKNSITVPAGTPVEVIGQTTLDGVNTYIVLYDGAALLVPSPEDAPQAIVSGDTAVATVKKVRESKKKDGTATKTRKAPEERGPSLKDAFLFVVEGKDGGHGPLQTDGAFAAAVRRKCIELGIGDKAATFLQKADKHVPYYMNGYKPKFDKDNGTPVEAGRQNIEKPLVWVVAAINARRYYLKGDGLSHEQRLAQIPEPLLEQINSDRDAVYTVPVKE